MHKKTKKEEEEEEEDDDDELKCIIPVTRFVLIESDRDRERVPQFQRPFFRKKASSRLMHVGWYAFGQNLKKERSEGIKHAREAKNSRLMPVEETNRIRITCGRRAQVLRRRNR